MHYKIENCTYLRIVNDLLFCDIEDICYMNFQKTEIPNDTILISNNDKTYFYENSCLYEVSITTGSINEPFKYEPSSYIEPIEDYYLVFNRISRKEKNYRLVDREQKTIWLDDRNWGYKIINNFIFLLEEHKIYNINIQTGIPCWQYTLPEGFKIFGSVQAIGDVLFFRITDKNLDNSKNVGLRIESGEVLWEIDDTTYFQIDYKKKLLRGYSGAYYQVMDPFEGKLLVNKYFKDNWDKGIYPSSHNNTITDDKLWFVSGRGENAKFGAIDLQTSEVDFIQDFPLENDGQLEKPVYHEGQLYLHDSNNVLYVLE